ncbi:hypothetical protein [Stenotrophomonas sp.]|uniref:hypothetical protein n=1 Tax=Stenotrophomonas sp. TaxID=69392 RepID=UPI0028A0E0FE|nr:hypothetical protein [Stenotrophomonas sp.]
MHNETRPQPRTATAGGTPPTPPPSPANDDIGGADVLLMFAQWLQQAGRAKPMRFSVEFDGTRLIATLGHDSR